MASETTSAVFSRLFQYCTSHRIPMPPLEYEGFELVLTDDLIRFCDQENMSLDWLICGVVHADRNNRRAQKP